MIVLLLGVTGCGNRQGTSPAASEPQNTSAPEASAGTPEPESPAEPAEMTTFSDDMLTMVVEISQAAYTINDIIDVRVSIINNSGGMIQYVHGSGSYIVPDALRIGLGGLNPLFFPEIMTMDYQVSVLEPGETMSFDCPFAPYIPNSGEFVYGTGHDLSFFEQGDFTPVPAGILAGTAEFSYMPMPEGSEVSPLPMDDAKTSTLGGEFSVTIE